MAVMINSSSFFDPRSHEDIIWNALKKLPDDWYVFHSIHIYDPHVDDYDGKQEVEMDFVVLIPSKGCIVIEAKSGGVTFTTEPTSYLGMPVPPYTWTFYSGQPMNPFAQVHTAMYCLSEYIASKNLKQFVERENFYRCVWFQQIPGIAITSLPNRPEAPKDIILTADSLSNPEEALLKIIAVESQRIPPKTNPWNLEDIRYVTQHVLAPAMSLCPSKNWEYDQNVEKLNAMSEKPAWTGGLMPFWIVTRGGNSSIPTAFSARAKTNWLKKRLFRTILDLTLFRGCTSGFPFGPSGPKK